MGYWGLNSWMEVDVAADLEHEIEHLCKYKNKKDETVIRLLEKEIKDAGNDYNPPGPVNIALVLESGILDFLAVKKHKKFFVKLKNILTKITDIAKQKALWNEEKNRLEHLKAYKRLEKSVDTFIKKIR